MKRVGRFAAAVSVAFFCTATQVGAINTTGWTCSNDTGCGTQGADGVVANAPVPGSMGYGWVSTAHTENASPNFPPAALPAGTPTQSVRNGATYTSAPFTAAANVPISFYFNYVTSDGTTYTDYAWARLLDAAGNQVALLFTARTDPVNSVVPGNGMPMPQATLTPASVPITAGAPAWTPLGTYNIGSGRCYAAGCGYSGWVRANYTIAAAGSYRLEIGVVNWSDNAYQSGLAIDGLLVDGQAPGQTIKAVPALDLAGLGLLSAALAALGLRRRAGRRR